MKKSPLAIINERKINLELTIKETEKAIAEGTDKPQGIPLEAWQTRLGTLQTCYNEISCLLANCLRSQG